MITEIPVHTETEERKLLNIREQIVSIMRNTNYCDSMEVINAKLEMCKKLSDRWTKIFLSL